MVEPPAPGAQTITRGFDLAHSFYSSEPAATPPLGVAWVADLGGVVSSPLVADGRVFASVSEADGSYGATIVALDAATGRELWRVPIDTIYFSVSLGYEGGRLIAADSGGKLYGFDATTGAQQWVAQSPRGYPVVAHGLVYVQGSNSVHVFDAATGAKRFEAPLSDGTDGVPAISGDRLFVLGRCRAGAFDRRSGSRIWLLDDQGCTGGGGLLTSLYRRRVIGEKYFLDADNGARIPGATPVSVIAGDVGVTLAGQGLEARNLGTGEVIWTFAPAGAYSPDGRTALAAANDTVLWRSGSLLHALERRTGKEVWAGYLDPSKDGHIGFGGIDQDFAIGSGLVVLPVYKRIWALSGAVKDPPPTIEVDSKKTALVTYGRPASFTAIVRSTGLAQLYAVQVDQDQWPPGNFKRVSSKSVARDTAVTVAPKPERNSVFRIGVASGNSETVGAIVVPRYSSRRLDGGGPRIGRVRLGVNVPSNVRLHGKTAGAYVARPATKRYVRLGAGRLTGRRGAFSTTFAFRTVARLRRGEFITFCVRDVDRQGMSFGDRLDRRCGASRVRF